MIHKIHCERNTIRCEKCNAPISKSEKEEHDNQNHALKPCPNCQAQIEASQFGSHICPKAPKLCPYCEATYPLDLFNSHAQSCGNRTEICRKCNKYIPIKDLKKHIDTGNCNKPQPQPKYSQENYYKEQEQEEIERQIKLRQREDLARQRIREEEMQRKQEVEMARKQKEEEKQKADLGGIGRVQDYERGLRMRKQQASQKEKADLNGIERVQDYERGLKMRKEQDLLKEEGMERLRKIQEENERIQKEKDEEERIKDIWEAAENKKGDYANKRQEPRNKFDYRKMPHPNEGQRRQGPAYKPELPSQKPNRFSPPEKVVNQSPENKYTPKYVPNVPKPPRMVPDTSEDERLARELTEKLDREVAENLDRQFAQEVSPSEVRRATWEEDERIARELVEQEDLEIARRLAESTEERPDPQIHDEYSAQFETGQDYSYFSNPPRQPNIPYPHNPYNPPRPNPPDSQFEDESIEDQLLNIAILESFKSQK